MNHISTFSLHQHITSIYAIILPVTTIGVDKKKIKILKIKMQKDVSTHYIF